MVDCSLPELSVLGLDIEEGAVCLEEVSLRGEGPLVVLPKLSIHNRLGELEVSFSLLVALEHVHAASKVVVNCRCIYRVSSKRFFSDCTSLQIESQSPSWLFHVEKN